MTKKFTLHEFRRDGAAIYRHKRTVAPRTGLMNEFCHQLLAGPGFSADVDGGMAASDASESFRASAASPGTSPASADEYAGVGVLGPDSLMAVVTNLRRPVRSSAWTQNRRRQFERAALQFNVAVSGYHSHRYASGAIAVIHSTRSKPSRPGAACRSNTNRRSVFSKRAHRRHYLPLENSDPCAAA